MTEFERAALAYVEQLDYMDNWNRSLAGNGFIAGAEWHRDIYATIPFRGPSWMLTIAERNLMFERAVDYAWERNR